MPAPKADTTRPQFAWIPFYEELAQKLLTEGWRDRQGELVEFIKMLAPQQDNSVPPGMASLADAHIDPFSIFAFINNKTGPEKKQSTIDAYRKYFRLTSTSFQMDFFAPQVMPISAAFFAGFKGIKNDTEKLWDVFDYMMYTDPFDPNLNEQEFASMIDQALSVKGVGRSKLTAGLYWIKPNSYLHVDTVNSVGGDDLGIKATNGNTYLQCLLRTAELHPNWPLPRINNSEYLKKQIKDDQDTSYAIEDMLSEGVFLDEQDLESILATLHSKKNLILQGPPGVGKTFIARKLAYALIRRKGPKAENQIESVQFHQSYAYEDFIGGYRPTTNKDDHLIFTPRDGTFVQFCNKARENPNSPHILLIDEINRGNLSRIFGEMLMLIEPDKRSNEHAITLLHDTEDQEFYVPENIYIIGTMNLADRSLTGMDIALRRRFGFQTLQPQFESDNFENWMINADMPTHMLDRIKTRMSALNKTISDDPSLGRNFEVGHSFFCPPIGYQVNNWNDWYLKIVKTEIQPLLEEYWFDAHNRADEEVEKLNAGG